MEKTTPQERAQLLQAFNMFDKDHNGSLDKGEISDVLSLFCKITPGPNLVERVFAFADTDKSGTIEFEEFIQALDAFRLDRVTEAQSVFKALDIDGNGAIDGNEFIQACASIGITMNGNDVALLFETYDSNHDGQIDFDEFCVLMRSL